MGSSNEVLLVRHGETNDTAAGRRDSTRPAIVT
jgi:phosphohistidine phosphatase SixA